MLAEKLPPPPPPRILQDLLVQYLQVAVAGVKAVYPGVLGPGVGVGNVGGLAG